MHSNHDHGMITSNEIVEPLTLHWVINGHANKEAERCFPLQGFACRSAGALRETSLCSQGFELQKAERIEADFLVVFRRPRGFVSFHVHSCV